MACETYVQRARDQAERERRQKELKDKTEALSKGIASGTIKVVIGPQGAVAFQGWNDRGPVTDACAYRRIMSSGSALARAKIAAAEQLADRSIDKRVVNSGVHSHDSGKTWETH
jgi:hypothetical protein